MRFGILRGYALRGQTASLVTNVEYKLNVSAARVRSLERGPQLLEAKVGVDNAIASAEKIARAYESVRSISRQPSIRMPGVLNLC